MPIVLGLDLGTTKISCVAVDTESGSILTVCATANDANVTSPDDRVRGRSEWNAARILFVARQCLKDVAERLDSLVSDVAAIGVTGQQHGLVLVDVATRQPVSPLINWQDRRALDPISHGQTTWLQAARSAIGPDAWQRTGCWLHPGFMAVTLFELATRKQLPKNAQSLFIMDLMVAALTDSAPITEPSCAGSSGVFDVRTRDWNEDVLLALGLDRSLFPEVHEANYRVGGLTKEQAVSTGLMEGTPVFAPIGDHQASFLGSISDRQSSVLVNVGTGAQVAMYTDGFDFALPIELRPCPLGGNLLSNVGLAGGWSYQVLEQFFQDAGNALFATEPTHKLYETMNRLAVRVPAGADGLRCEPRFSGTRLDPTVRGSITGLSPQNFTAGHLARAVLEGMGRSLYDGFAAIQDVNGKTPASMIAAGNGLRENQLLAEIVVESFGLPLTFREHREEAAFGAALVSSVGANLFPDLAAAATRMIRCRFYSPPD